MNYHFRSHTFGGESIPNGDQFQPQHQQLNSTTGAPATRPIDIPDGSSNGIIRIHSDSQQSLDRLFNPLASEVTNVVPLRQRNLPSSFFNPRASSRAIKMEDQHQQQPQPQPQQQMAHHYRNYSSPVFMANQLVPGQTQAQLDLHHRQGSSSESFGYMTIASSSSSINQPQQPQQHCHQAGTIVQQQQPASHHFNNSHCSSSSNSEQYLHNNGTLNNHNNGSHHNHQQIQHSQQQQQAYVVPQTQLVQPQQQVVQHYRNYSSPAFTTNQIPQNGSLAQAVPQQPQVQAPLPQANLQANLHPRQASSAESFEYVTQTNGAGAAHDQVSQVQTHYSHHAQQQQPHCQQVPDMTPQQQPIQFDNQHCSSNLDQNQNYHHQHAQPEPVQLAGSTMLARSVLRRPPYGVSSLGQ